MPPADENKDAVELIRSKISHMYGSEPNARQEAAEAEAARPRSKHQQFMHQLTTSGKSLAEIQTEWHNYYVNLPNDEKHQVWQEFYAVHGKSGQSRQTPVAVAHPSPEVQPSPTKDTAAIDIKKRVLRSISKRAKTNTKRKHQLKSLGFGLSMGLVVLAILLFGFFNERFIAPFITPSRTVSATPIITDLTNNEHISPNPVIIIPKINIEIPVVYDEPSIDEEAVQHSLEKGILHYPTTSNPGEQGNAVFFGHSSSNILNNGKYKFAFVLLNRLQNGDTFMIQKDGKRYVYKVFDRKIVPPTDVSVLDPLDRPTATLITCDPPGTNVNRLVVIGEQISPDPVSNIASSVKATRTPQTLPSQSVSLWSRMWKWLSS
jgi:sortase A